MSRRVDVLLALALLAATALGQGTPDPTLDLPCDPSAYMPRHHSTAPVASVTTTHDDDARDESPPVFFGEEIESENDTLVYVVDVSGSMRRGGRIVRAQRELRRSIVGLPPNVRFNVVSYSCAVRRWSPSLRAASPNAKASAIAWVEAITPYGATGTGPACALALSEREVQAVALLTDGAPNCGAEGPDGHRVMIQSANLQRATINVFGVAASGDYRAFCQNVARDSGGSYYDVP